MGLNDTYSRVRVGIHLSDMFPMKNCSKRGDVLSPLLFNFDLEYATRRVQVNQQGLKLTGTHQRLVYADDTNTKGGSVHTIKKNIALVVAGMKNELDVNADKNKYIIISRDQNVERSHSTKTDNSYLERLEPFKDLGSALMNQNSIQEEIKSRLKSGNACYHSVHNILSFILLSKNIKIKMYRTIILHVVLYGC